MGHRQPRATAYARSHWERWRHPKDRLRLSSVAICRNCGGVVARCPVCGHVHCDDDCRPIECIRAEGVPDGSYHQPGSEV